MSAVEHEDAQPRVLRRDAARNRDRIIVAARELVAVRGLGVGLNEIAHHAGVGVGTVYRRFPDREALIRAALAEPLDQITAVGERAASAERGWDGLRDLLQSAAELLARNLGVRAVALSPDGRDVIDAIAERARTGLEALLRDLLMRAIVEGDVRPDVTTGDVALVLWTVTEVAIHSADVAPDAYRRHLQLLLDGMRSGPGREPLAVSLTEEQLTAIGRSWAQG